MCNYLKKNPFITACLPLLAAWFFISFLAPKGLQNDDFQLWFMYCNGGAGAVPFSLHSGVLEGWLLMGLNAVSDQMNWYLILLHFIASAACLGLNLYATTRWCADTKSECCFSTARIITLLAVLFYINYQSIFKAQYTYLAILCACVSLFLFYDWCKGLGSRFRLPASLALFCCAYELRDQSLAAFCIMGGGVLLAAILSRRNTITPRRRSSILLFPALLIAMLAADVCVFHASPAWNEARQFGFIRTGIQDARDNSGIDKTVPLAQAGIDKRTFDLFCTFTYIPGFAHESAAELSRIRDIHQMYRKGLMGSDLAARAGFLSMDGYRFKGGDSLLRALDPWIPLLLSLVFLLLGISRRGILHALPIIAATGFYFGILYLLQRPVERVLHPVLYASSIWILAGPVRSRFFSRQWITCAGSALAAVLAVCFLLRHARWHLQPEPAAGLYCAQNPQNLYLTTSMQGLNLYPTGWNGVSLNYFATTNIIPISDGWCFYSPAYKEALKARGISNPYAELCKPNTYLVTQNNTNENGMLRLISNVHSSHMGSALQFEKTETVGKFTFWQAKPVP